MIPKKKRKILSLMFTTAACLAVAAAASLLPGPASVSAAPCRSWQTPDGNGYCAEYEVDIGEPPPPDIVLTADSSYDEIQAALNDPLYRCIAFAPGDYRSLADRFIITTGGDGGNRRWLILDGGGSSPPWRLDTSEQAILPSFGLEGVSHLVIHRLTFDGRGIGGTEGILLGRWAADLPSTDNIIDSVYVRGYRQAGIIGFSDTAAIHARNVVQNSVLHGMPVDAGELESMCISAEELPELHVVNCELFDAHDNIDIGNDYTEGLLPGTVIENCDIYQTSEHFTDCEGHYAADGPCGVAENFVVLKAGGVPEAPARILHNRFWGGRPADFTLIGYDDGNPDFISNSGVPDECPICTPNVYVMIKDNVMDGGIEGVGGWWGNPYGIEGHQSISGNIIYDLSDLGNEYSDEDGTALFVRGKSHSETYLNTVIDARGRWMHLDELTDFHDARCNVILSSGQGDAYGSESTEIDQNVFYETPSLSTVDPAILLDLGAPLWEPGMEKSVGDLVRSEGEGKIMRCIAAGTTGASEPDWPELGGSVEDGSATWQVVRGPFCFYRKLQTTPEQVCIPYAAVHEDAPEAGWCPDTLGDRPGIGINDDAGFSGIFAEDMTGRRRTGTAGALEAVGDAACRDAGYQCCEACASGPHPELDGDCAGQVCCGTCAVDDAEPPAEDLDGERPDMTAEAVEIVEGGAEGDPSETNGAEGGCSCSVTR